MSMAAHPDHVGALLQGGEPDLRQPGRGIHHDVLELLRQLLEQPGDLLRGDVVGFHRAVRGRAEGVDACRDGR